MQKFVHALMPARRVGPQVNATLLGTDIEPVFLSVPLEKTPGSEFAYNNTVATVSDRADRHIAIRLG
jgi:hypothetical protein